MRNNEYNLFVSDKKKPSFAEWTMQNGVSLNQTTQKPLTLGEVAPKATERATSSASTTTQTRDPFLEGFYSTEDKPETERKTYLQHRTPIVERMETKKPEKINLPYRPSAQGQPKITQYGNVSSQNQTYKPRYITNQNLLDTAKTNNEDDEFLQGFNRDRKEESKWNRMLDAVERGVRIYNGEEENASPYSRMAVDVIKAGARPGSMHETKKSIEDAINNINAIKGYFGGDYSNAELLAEIMEWDKADAEKVIAVLTGNNEEKSKEERELNKTEVALRLGGEAVDKAVEIGKTVLWGGPFSSTYSTNKKIEDMLKAAHYSRNHFNEGAPQSISEAEAMGWVKKDKKYCHLFGFPDSSEITKYMPLTGGGEQIFYDPKEDDEIVVTDPKNKATYNWFNYDEHPILHGVFDVAPWVLWGNDYDDTTTLLERIWLPGVYEAYEKN